MTNSLFLASACLGFGVTLAVNGFAQKEVGSFVDVRNRRCFLYVKRTPDPFLGKAAVHADKEITYIRFDSKSNQKLAENFHGDGVGNDLAELPKGEQTFVGARFKVGEGVIQLRSTMLPHMPERIEGIKVGQSFAKLYVLQGCGWGGTGSDSVSDDTVIGQYTVRYDDNTSEVIPIAYGKDVRDWWNHDNSKPVARGKVAWIGSNENSRMFNVSIRLYLSTWENPQPDKSVRSIDFITTGDTAAAPFCVAMTAESK